MNRFLFSEPSQNSLKLRVYFYCVEKNGRVFVEGKVWENILEEEHLRGLKPDTHVKISLRIRDIDDNQKTQNLNLRMLSKADTVVFRISFGKVEQCLSSMAPGYVLFYQSEFIEEYILPDVKEEIYYDIFKNKTERSIIKIHLNNILFFRCLHKIVLIGHDFSDVPDNKPHIHKNDMFKVNFDFENPNFDLKTLTQTKYLEIEVEETHQRELLPYPVFISLDKVKIFKGIRILTYNEN